MPKKITISGLFLDFDGTISCVRAPMETAQPTPLVKKTLRKIAEKIPVAMVTTKDMQFIRERTPFAWAWAAIGGLEIQIKERVLEYPQAECYSSLLESLSVRLDDKAKRIDKSIFVERKRLSDGKLAGICVDWRLTKGWNKVKTHIEGLLDPFKEQGLVVLGYPNRPYVDIYPKLVDKQRAFQVLKSQLKIEGPIMYLGDSELDEPAFQVSDVSIGVLHGESASKLDSQFFVYFDCVGQFLEELRRNSLVFNPESQWIMLNEPGDSR